MPKLNFKKGTTSKTQKVFAQNSTTSAPLTGLAFGTAGLSAYYIREGDATATAITLVTATVGTWVSGGFVEVDSTHMPGIYEVGIPNAALATAKSSLIYIQGAASLVPIILELQLDAVDNQDAAAGGMTNLDATVSSAATAASSANTTSTAIKAKTDNLPASPASTSDVQPIIVLPGA